MSRLFGVIESGEISAPLFDIKSMGNQFNNNRDYVYYSTVKVLSSSFNHLKLETLQTFVQGLFSLYRDMSKLTDHCTNFIITLKQIEQVQVQQ